MYGSLSGRSHSPTEGGATSLAEVAVLPTVRASRCANLQALQTDVFMQPWLQKKKGNKLHRGRNRNEAVICGKISVVVSFL